MTLANDYSTSEPVTFEVQSAPEVLQTVTIEDQQVSIVRYATLEMRHVDDAPKFGRTRTVYAIRTGAPIQTLSRSFYLHDGQYHQAGVGVGGDTVAGVVNRSHNELSSSMTVQGAIDGARKRIQGDRLYAQYAPVAEANIGAHTREDFEALDPDAPIEPGDLVVVVSHSKYRTGVAIKAGRTRVECLAATPTGKVANGATRTRGKDVRLLRKRITEAPGPAAADDDGEWRRTYDAHMARLMGKGFSEAEAHHNADRLATARVAPTHIRDLHADAAELLRKIDAAPAGTVAMVDADGDVTYAAADDLVGGGAGGVVQVLDDQEQRRARLGAIFARWQGLADAVDGCTLYRMVRARTRHRVVRLHDVNGALVATLGETPDGWFAETANERLLPAGTGLFARFADAVDAVRADHGADATGEEGAGMGTMGAMAMQARPVMPMEPVPGEPARCRGCGTVMALLAGRWRTVRQADAPALAGEHDHVAVRAAWLEQWREQYAADPVGALLGLVDEVGVERALETMATGEGAGDTTADEAAARARAVRAQLAGVLSDPAALRAVADRVEREQLGHVTEIEGPDSAGHFEWRCVQGDAEQTGLERGEEAYAAATAHGPLVAGSVFARRPPVVHDCGVSRRSFVGSLTYQPYEGGDWTLAGYGMTTDVDEDDVVGAQAWASGLIAADRAAPPVARWEHHQDPHGEWWEPVY